MSRTNRNSQPLSSVERGQRLPREGKDASPRRPLDGIVALAPTDSILADQRRAAATATAVALRGAELEAAVSAEGESTEDLLESILPEGSHVPEFRLVPLIPTPGSRAANDGGALFDRSGRPLAAAPYSPWRARISFAFRLALAIVVFSLAIATSVEMTSAKQSIESSRRALTTACGSATLL